MAIINGGDLLQITDADGGYSVLTAFQNEDGTVDVVISVNAVEGVHVRLAVTLDYASIDGASNWFRRARTKRDRRT